MTERMTDAQLDREIEAFLDWESNNLAGAPTAGELAARVREHVRPGSRLPMSADAQQRLRVLLLAAVLALLLATAAFVGQSRPQLPTSVENGWVAVSSQPGYRQTFGTDWALGGDIYLAREGAELRVIVERGSDMKRNVCPQFSPDGSMLAYGELAGIAASLVVLEVSDEGAATGSRRFVLPGASSVAPCPRWSRNGTHLAYLDGVRWDSDGRLENAGTGVVVVDHNGVAVSPTAQDPSTVDLRLSGTFDPVASPDGSDPLQSPDGELRATCREDIGLVFGPADGSADRLVTRYCQYSLAAWSPDGSRILQLSDSGMAVSMLVSSVTGPAVEERVGSVPINGARSFPGRGDTSWQPVHP